MKKILILMILIVTGCFTEQKLKKTFSYDSYEEYEVNQNSPEKVKMTVQIFDNFFKELSNELLNSIKNQGLVKTISICKKVSPNLAEKFSKESNIRVYRISDKNRNPMNKPSIDEQMVLEIWKKRILDGKKISAVYFTTDDNKTKVMRPIKIMGDLCLQCHGEPEKMNPELLKEIKKEYPEDKAINYKLDELRGAFVAEF